jgi:phosphoribosylaminoimidazolecarboxamide formyltransferase / IMP cyclohydrolase
MVIVDLYPFVETLHTPGSTESEITEQIDIGGVSLLRAAAKNHNDVVVISSATQYEMVANWIQEQKGEITSDQRKYLAAEAMRITSTYDMQISDWLHGHSLPSFSMGSAQVMRYGENPHQKAVLYGDNTPYYRQISGKQLSYNNLNDLDGALSLIREFQQFEKPVFAIIKHTNACGLAAGNTVFEAWHRALACDPTSAFGGVLACNRLIDITTAEALHELFFELVIAPGYTEEAVAILTQKKNRILLIDTGKALPKYQGKTILGGMLVQDNDTIISEPSDRKTVAGTAHIDHEDIVFAEKAVKHLKSNAIAIVKSLQMIGSGAGHTSRVDAVTHAITKANTNGFDTTGAVLSSDAFFPFPDNLALAKAAGIGVILQPGGSVKDAENIAYCQAHSMNMIFTGMRHFKH